MKKLLFTIILLGCYLVTSAQNPPKVGDQLTIKAPHAHTFNYIKFPKPNILIKRGTVDRYKSVYDNDVLVDDVETAKNGDTYVILKKKDGSKFFGYLSEVKANYAKALDAGEIVTTK